MAKKRSGSPMPATACTRWPANDASGAGARRRAAAPRRRSGASAIRRSRLAAADAAALPTLTTRKSQRCGALAQARAAGRRAAVGRCRSGGGRRRLRSRRRAPGGNAAGRRRRPRCRSRLATSARAAATRSRSTRTFTPVRRAISTGSSPPCGRTRCRLDPRGGARIVAAVAAAGDAGRPASRAQALDQRDGQRRLAGAADGDVADHDHRHAARCCGAASRVRYSAAAQAGDARRTGPPAARAPSGTRRRRRTSTPAGVALRHASAGRSRNCMRCRCAYSAARCQQLRVRALLDHAALVQHQHLVGVFDGRQPVRDDQRRAVGHQVVERVLHQAFGFGVERGGGLVEDQDRRVLQHRARDREALALAAGQRAALARRCAVSRPSGRRSTNSIAFAPRTARSSVCRIGASAFRRTRRWPRRVPSNSITCCPTSAICRRRSARR